MRSVHCGGDVCVIAVYPVAGTLYGWVPCLCGAPDVPHAGHESQVSYTIVIPAVSLTPAFSGHL